MRILEELNGGESILDLGCGNGELARRLARCGFTGRYLGLDSSRVLLQEVGKLPGNFAFAEADLAAPGWEKMIDTPFDFVFCFAVLHHIPSRELRVEILDKVRNLLEPGGRFVHSEWQFLASQKLKGRIQPWSEIGLSAADVDPGDALLDWRSGGGGLRYVHAFDEAELDALAKATRFRVRETFRSDGESQQLGLYQVWEAI